MDGRPNTKNALQPFDEISQEDSVHEIPMLDGSVSVRDKSRNSFVKDSESKLIFKDDDPNEKKHALFGILYYCVFCLVFNFTFVITKYLYENNPNITVIDNVVSKSLVSVFVYYIMAKRDGINLLEMDKDTYLYMSLRLLFGCTTMFLITYTINYLPVSTTTLITNMSPFYIALFGYLLIGEKLHKIEILLILVGFGGIYLICIDQPDEVENPGDQFFGTVIMVIASITMALGYIYLRKVNKKLSPVHSPFFFFVCCLSMSIIGMIIFPDLIPKVTTYDKVDCTLLFCGSLTSFVSQFCLSTAYKYEKAARLAPYMYLQVIAAIVSDLVIFDISFTSLQVLGMAIISVCLLIPAFMKYYGYIE